MQRFGVGYDIHRLIAGRRLVLGGIHIEHESGLDGHSDADVVAHAIMDALLGAAGLGDIGRYFPPSDPAFRDADSMMLLSQVRDLLTQQGWKPWNIDVTVVAERPRLQPHIEKMRTRLARAVGLEAHGVNVKATTNEGLGPEGREEGISALAVASIVADRVEEHREHSPNQHHDRQEGDLLS